MMIFDHNYSAPAGFQCKCGAWVRYTNNSDPQVDPNYGRGWVRTYACPQCGADFGSLRTHQAGVGVPNPIEKPSKRNSPTGGIYDQEPKP